MQKLIFLKAKYSTRTKNGQNQSPLLNRLSRSRQKMSPKDLQNLIHSISSEWVMKRRKISKKACRIIRRLWRLITIILEVASILPICLQTLEKANVQQNISSTQSRSILILSMHISALEKLCSNILRIKMLQFHISRKFWNESPSISKLWHSLEFFT